MGRKNQCGSKKKLSSKGKIGSPPHTHTAVYSCLFANTTFTQPLLLLTKPLPPLAQPPDIHQRAPLILVLVSPAISV